eukprot:291391_1
MCCFHQSIVELIVDHNNPTSLLYSDHQRFVMDLEGDDYYMIETSEKQRTSSVWSINCPLAGGVSIVHINESHGAITCNLCRSVSKWCQHRETVNAAIFEITGGKLDVKKIFRAQ